MIIEPTEGIKRRITPEVGETTTEEALDANTEASNTVSAPPHEVTSLMLSRAYHWFFAWGDKRRLMEDALTRGGFKLDTIGLEDGGPLAHTTDKYGALLGNSLDVAEVSQMLGTEFEDILQRLEDRTLYGIPTNDGWKIFRFQFEQGRLLPGLEEVLPLLHEELHPIAVYNWFVSPSIDLVVGNNRVSPRQWLLSGRNVGTVARIAIDV